MTAVAVETKEATMKPHTAATHTAIVALLEQGDHDLHAAVEQVHAQLSQDEKLGLFEENHGLWLRDIFDRQASRVRQAIYTGTREFAPVVTTNGRSVALLLPNHEVGAQDGVGDAVAGMLPESTLHPQPVLCKGTTKKGNPCQAQPVEGQDYCLTHGGHDPRLFSNYAYVDSWVAAIPGERGLRVPLMELTGEQLGKLSEDYYKRAGQNAAYGRFYERLREHVGDEQRVCDVLTVTQVSEILEVCRAK